MQLIRQNKLKVVLNQNKKCLYFQKIIKKKSSKYSIKNPEKNSKIKKYNDYLIYQKQQKYTNLVRDRKVDFRNTAPCTTHISRSVSQNKLSSKTKSLEKQSNDPKFRFQNKKKSKKVSQINLRKVKLPKQTTLSEKMRTASNSQPDKRVIKMISLGSPICTLKPSKSDSLSKLYPKSLSIGKNSAQNKTITKTGINRFKKSYLQPSKNKELKKQPKAYYFSTKPSQRNSVNFIEKSENDNVQIGQSQLVRRPKVPKLEFQEEQLQSNEYYYCSNLNQFEGKHQRCFQELPLQTQDFSFQKSKNHLPSNSHKQLNKNDTSLDRIFEGQQDHPNWASKQCSFHSRSNFELQSEQNLKFRLQGLSLQRLKQEEYKIQTIKQLNEFQQFLKVHDDKIGVFKIMKKVGIQLKIDPEMRCRMLDWLSMISSTLLLNTETFHLAVCYFDMYIKKQMDEKQIKIISLGCLVLAIKMEQRQYESDLLNVLTALQQVSKQDLITAEKQIFEGLNLKLKYETLPFWINYLERQWDHFLIDKSLDRLDRQRLLLRYVDEHSYANVRRINDIINTVVLDSGIFQHKFIDIAIATVYLILLNIVEKSVKQKVLSQISVFKANKIVNQTNDYECHELLESKSSIVNYTTYQTLDDLSLKQNINNNCLKGSKIRRLNIKNDEKGLSRQVETDKGHEQFTVLFEAFLQKQSISLKSISEIQSTISYIRQFLSLKQTLQIDPRVYEQSQCYESFIQYHTHSPYSKLFVNKLRKGKN